MTDTHTTAHIPDEAVQAALEQIHAYDYVPDENDFSNMKDAIKSALSYISAPCAVEVPTKEERHANTARNLIINQTSTDLEQIINGHDPEQSILNNDVWDRLDKMACEIEALTKPVDVAAVRNQGIDMPDTCDGKEQYAFEDWAKSNHYDMHEHPLHYLFLDKRTSAARDGWRAAIKYCRERALSAEPAHGEQSDRAALEKGGR